MLVEAGSQQALHIVDQATLPDILWGGNGSANHAVEEEQHCFFDGNRIGEASGRNGFEEAALQQVGLGVAAPAMPPEGCVLCRGSDRANRLQCQITTHGKPVAAVAASTDFAALINLGPAVKGNDVEAGDKRRRVLMLNLNSGAGEDEAIILRRPGIAESGIHPVATKRADPDQSRFVRSARASMRAGYRCPVAEVGRLGFPRNLTRSIKSRSGIGCDPARRLCAPISNAMRH